MAQGVHLEELRGRSIWRRSGSKIEEEQKSSGDQLRWLLFIPLILLLIFGCGSLALIQTEPAQADTRSRIAADYQPWEFTVFKPVDPDIVEEIQKDQELYPEVFEEPVQPVVAPGSFWDPTETPVPGALTPTPTGPATQTQTPTSTLALTPTALASATPTLTATVSPTSSSTPTSTPFGPPSPIPPGVPPANTYWFFDDTTPLSHMMYTTLANGNDQSSGSVSFHSPSFYGGQVLQAGTTTANFYAWNSAPAAAVFSVELRGGGTLLGAGTFALPSNTFDSYFFSASFSTGSHSFADGERLEVRFSLAAPAEIYWDGAFNYSGVSVPSVATTPTPTASSTATVSPTPSGTAAPSNTPTNTATNSPVPPTNTPTNTPVPITNTPTNTPVPPTPTNTPPPTTATPTNTPLPPTSTPLPPTSTPLPPTNTPLPPTNTPLPTSTPTQTATSVPGSGKMYWTDPGTDRIQRSNLDGSSVENLVTVGLLYPYGIALDPAAGKMYWVDQGTDRIQRANLNGSNVENLVTTGLVSPEFIDLDLAAGKMYWTDSGTDKIQRANIDGTVVEDLVTTGLLHPEGIELDIAAGKMYWADAVAARIQRANLDGTTVEDVITGITQVNGIALDLSAGKIYWVQDSDNLIRRANLNGTSIENVTPTGVDNPKGIDLDVTAGKMYFTESGLAGERIRRANLNGSSPELLVSGLGNVRGLALDL